jgi:hypothetical protein
MMKNEQFSLIEVRLNMGVGEGFMRTVLIASLAVLAACTQETAQPAGETPTADAANNCPAQASAPWDAFTIEAAASGADCVEAQATLTIRDANGAVVHTATYEAAQVMVLAGAQSPADMERMLREWVSPPGAAKDSTGDLPVWGANADQPASGEFPFYPEEGVDRASYEALRRGDAPMFCYVQGMESEACLVAQNGAVTKIGVQTFPG